MTWAQLAEAIVIGFWLWCSGYVVGACELLIKLANGETIEGPDRLTGVGLERVNRFRSLVLIVIGLLGPLVLFASWKDRDDR